MPNGSIKGKHIDGMLRPAASASTTVKSTKSVHKPAHAASSKPKSRTVQKSKTLHRKAVKKPAAAKPTDTPSVHTRRTASQPAGRLARAQKTERHPLVSRHGVNAPKKLETKIVPMAPKAHTATAHGAPAPHNAPKAYQPAKPIPKKTSVIERQIASAPNVSSHTREIRQKSWRSKLAAPAAMLPVLATGLLISGFVMYQRIPDISMRVAASRAGFSARMPDTPVGFRVDGPVTLDSGRISVNFESNTDDRTVTVHQQPSTLDSDSLRAGYLESNDVEYQTFSRNGSTVFVYGDSQATWLNQGVWFTLEGDSRLSPAQILDLAGSI